MLKKQLKKLFYKIYLAGKFIEQNTQYDSFRSKFQIHPNFRFNGENIIFYGDGRIVISEDSYIGAYSTVQAFKNCQVVIGKGCSISHNVKMYTQTYDADYDYSMLPIPEKTGDILIGDFVWIGANVFISPGVTIGDNAVIGANSLVNKNVEAFTIVGGVPARFIRKKKLPIVS